MTPLYPGDSLEPEKPTYLVQKVFVVQGDHWQVPGRPTTIHATTKGADARALELVNTMLGELEKPPSKNWKLGLKRVKGCLRARDIDPDEADVWIETLEVKS